MHQSQMNLLTDPVSRLLVRIAIPSSIGMFFNTMYNVVDTFYAGRVSTIALAAISLSFPFFIIIMAVGRGITSAANVLISNALGTGDKDEASMYHAQAVGMSVITSILLPLLLIPFLPAVFRFVGTTDKQVLQYALMYVNILIGGSIFMVLGFAFNAGLSARGLTQYFRNVTIIGFFLNIGLNPLFMYGLRIRDFVIFPAWGVPGIAIATVFIQAMGSMYFAWKTRRIACFMHRTCNDFFPRWKYVKSIIRLAIPPAIDFMMISIGFFIILKFISQFGTLQVAAYGVGIRIEQLSLLPTFGFSIALAAITGQNNGAGNIERIKKAYGISLFITFIFMIIIVGFALIYSYPLIRLFTKDELVVRYTRVYIFIQAITNYSYILMRQSSAVLQGIKKPNWLLISGPLRQLVAPLIVFPLLLTAFYGERGVWWGILSINWTFALIGFFIVLYKLNTRMGKACA